MQPSTLPRVPGGTESEGRIVRMLSCWLVGCAALMAGFTAGFFAPHHDGLVPVTRMDYVNTYPAFTIACTHRGSRTTFRDDGSDIAPGDRLIRDCKVTGR